MVASMGLAVANIGVAIPWNDDTFWTNYAGANPVEWIFNVLFVMLALGLILGWLKWQRLLRWSALGSAGLWTTTGWYLWLTSNGTLKDISLGIVCWGLALISFSIDYNAQQPGEGDDAFAVAGSD